MPYRVLVVGLLLLLCVMQYQLWFGQSGLIAWQSVDVKIDALRLQNQQLKTANDQLRQQVQDLKHGVDLIEELARYELNLVAEEETFFRYVDGDVLNNRPAENVDDDISSDSDLAPSPNPNPSPRLNNPSFNDSGR